MIADGNMMKMGKLLLIYTLSILIAGCADITDSATIIAAPTDVVGSPLSTRTSTEHPTSAAIPTPIPTSPLPDGYQIDCVETVREMPPNHHFKGSIVLDPYRPYGPVLLDLSSGEVIPLENENEISWKFRVSPNRQLLAYNLSVFSQPSDINNPNSDKLSDWLVVTSSTRKEIIRIPWGDDWGWIVEWLTNELILMGKQNGKPFVINPFTEEITEISVKFTDIYNIPPHLWWRQYGSASYVVVDPTLTWAIYPFIDESTYIIWDLASGVETTRLPSHSIRGRPPIWSPDGSQFLISNFTRNIGDDYRPIDELYSISRRVWQKRQLTNLSSIFPSGAEIDMYEWSPDGSKIAFTIDAAQPIHPDVDNRIIGEPGKSVALAILDVTSNEISFLCINTFPGINIFWSPNGTQLLVIARLENEDTTALIDIDRGVAVLLHKDAQPYGWMIDNSKE